MALADILNRIDGDTETEVSEILSAAEQRADAIVVQAEARAAEHRAEVAEKAAAAAAREADTIVVNARLAARDAEVTARRELIAEALAETAEAFAALPDDEYATALARYVVAAARGGETLSVGSADLARVTAIANAIEAAAPALRLDVASEPAPFERGVLLRGSRVRADLSVSAIVAERREELEMVVSRMLFPEEA